jgi:hypothetical protein
MSVAPEAATSLPDECGPEHGALFTHPYFEAEESDSGASAPPTGGNQWSLELGLPMGSGLQIALVDDAECGIGFVASGQLAADMPVPAAVDAKATLMGGYTRYSTSFDEFSESTQVAVTAGDGAALGARVYVDADGEIIGGGSAVGAGAGLGASLAESVIFYKAFSDCEED